MPFHLHNLGTNIIGPPPGKVGLLRLTATTRCQSLNSWRLGLGSERIVALAGLRKYRTESIRIDLCDAAIHPSLSVGVRNDRLDTGEFTVIDCDSGCTFELRCDGLKD